MIARAKCNFNCRQFGSNTDSWIEYKKDTEYRVIKIKDQFTVKSSELGFILLFKTEFFEKFYIVER